LCHSYTISGSGCLLHRLKLGTHIASPWSADLCEKGKRKRTLEWARVLARGLRSDSFNMGPVLYEDNFKLLTRSRRFGERQTCGTRVNYMKNHEASLVPHLAQVVLCRYGNAKVK
jgi:hypothetical protein